MAYELIPLARKKFFGTQCMYRAGRFLPICLMMSCLMMICSGCYPSTRHAVTPGTKPLPDRVNHAIELSTAYLIHAMEPSGRFVYRIKLDRPGKTGNKYNMLRHAGTMYSLAQAYHHHPNNEIRRVLISTGKFLKSRGMAPLPGRDDMLGIWSLPSVNHTSKPPQIKLGGTGLGLVALISVEKITPGTTPIEELRKLGRFLLYMQKPDGSFYSKFIPSEGGRNDRWTSRYYPGQAALALLMLNDLSPSERWVTAAAKALAYLIKHRDMTTGDHWSLIAGAKLLSMDHYPKTILPPGLLVRHTARVCEQILQEQVLYAGRSAHIGGYSAEGRTTPTATRVEGLAAALRIIGDRDPLLSNTIKASMQSAIDFLLQAQVDKGKYAGAFPRGVARLRFKKSFNRRVREVRIDYVQHALSAMIEYQELDQ